MSGQDPNAAAAMDPAADLTPPTPDAPPTPETPNVGSAMQVPTPDVNDPVFQFLQQEHSSLAQQDAKAKASELADMVGLSSGPPQAYMAASPRRGRVQVYSVQKFQAQQLVTGALGGTGLTAPPTPETLEYDIMPGQTEQEARAQALERYRLQDSAAAEDVTSELAQGAAYTLSQTASTLSMGLSHFAFTSGFDEDYEKTHSPEDIRTMKLSSAALAMPAMLANSGLARAIPINAVWHGGQAAFMAAARAAFPTNLSRLASLVGGVEALRFVRPKTLEILQSAASKAGVVLKDGDFIIRDAVKYEKAASEFRAAVSALRAEMIDAGRQLGKFKVINVGEAASGGAAVGAGFPTTEALLDPAHRAEAQKRILPETAYGALLAGTLQSAFEAGKVVAKYVSRAKFSPFRESVDAQRQRELRQHVEALPPGGRK